MDCREIRPMLSAFHDNECTPAGRATVEAHLKGCPACARLLEALERLDARIEVPEPGPEYWDRFKRRVEERIVGREAAPGKAASQSRQGWIRQQLRYLIPAAAAAALIVWIVRFGGMGTYSPVPPEPRRVEEKPGPATGRPAGAPAEKRPEPARTPPSTPSPRPATSGRPDAAQGKKSVVGPASEAKPEPYAVSPRASAPADGEREIPGETEMAAEPPTRIPETPSAPPGAAMPKTASRFRAMADREEEGAGLGAAEDRSADVIRWEAGKPEAARSRLSDSSCDDARRLAAEGRFRDAEDSQRACLARDASPRAQEDGLILLAELLDRQARFTEADAVIEEARGRFPDSRALDLYRRQRPQVQSGELPFPASKR